MQSYDAGGVGGVEADGIALDHYQSDSGYTVNFSYSMEFAQEADTSVRSSDDGVLPEDSVQFSPGNNFQRSSLQFSGLDPDASGVAEVTVEGVGQDGLPTQQTFRVTVEDGQVKSVEYVGKTTTSPADGVSPANAGIRGGISPEASAIPGGNSSLPGGIATESGYSFDGVQSPNTYDVGESGRMTLDSYQSDSGNYGAVLPASLGFGTSVEGQILSSNESLISGDNVQLVAGNDSQGPALEFSNLNPDASGVAEITLVNIGEDGVPAQHVFHVTVEEGAVKGVQYLGEAEAIEGDAARRGGVSLEGGVTPEDAGASASSEGDVMPEGDTAVEGGVVSEDAAPQEGAAPEDGAPLEGGIVPEEGALLLPQGGLPLSVLPAGSPVEGLPLSAQLQYATQGAFVARQASLLNAVYRV
ncbi:MAG: hypothetical protein BECKG1743D_GA0114223_108212 [Candidatus Kentron sp. G]|nr:MAG: hypothetical protein BECKG1743F_GA0114225_108232 [Candidatus Kentron sp. G]VFN04902.1 MAG: hypothetical protein BECKG1743E_GA0114224_107922 [Candidatus Kentron sp. G]VFN06157.1 MAG: hypothetical protein BECKG1743D_GA0114223_108212 [Candidatus Kentron sp. G]